MSEYQNKPRYLENRVVRETCSCIEVINWKENKEVGPICFEIRVPMKNQWYFWNFSTSNKMLYFIGYMNFVSEEKKNILDSFYSIKEWLSFFPTFDISADSSVLFSMIFSNMWRTMAPRPNNKVFYVCLAASVVWTKVKLVFVFVIFRLPYILFCKLSKRDIVFIWHFEIADICGFCALLDYLLQSFLR